MNLTYPSLFTAMTAIALAGATFAGDRAELTGVNVEVEFYTSANTGGQSDSCEHIAIADSLDQLPFNEECFAGISGRNGADAIGEAFSKFNAFHSDDTLVIHTWLEAYAASFGNAGSGADIRIDGLLEFELPYQSEVSFNNCSTPEQSDNVVTFSLLNLATDEVIELDDGGFHDCGTTVLVLDAGYYGIQVDGHVQDFPGDEDGGGISTSITMDVSYLDSPRQRADLNGDGKVDGGDLTMLLAAWGELDSEADLDRDGIVDGLDLSILLGNWGWLGFGDPDLNGDGVVDLADVALAMAALYTSNPAADLDRSGIVDYDDIQIIMDAME